MSGVKSAMADFLKTDSAQLVILLAVLAVMITVGVYVVKKFRESVREEEVSANALLTNFRELHSRGTLSDEEYRSVKSQLGEKLKEETGRKVEKPAATEKRT